MTRSRSSLVALLALASVLSAVEVLAQRRSKPLAPGEGNTVPIAIAVATGGTQYAFSGQGRCDATEQASIYGVPAALWTVRHQDGSRSLTLTLWHPKNGSPDMMSLSVALGGTTHSLSTVKVGGQGEVRGSGTTSVQKQGSGGLFTIDATASDGTKIKGTVRCEAFTTPVAEGG
jgi:hypothetical protein